jgi:glycosyltransferase involved in cell wall biosynthesis
MHYVFFFPFVPPSGVSSLFVRMARAMAATGNQVRLVDFAGGAMTRMARHDLGLEFTEYHCDSRIEIRPDETLVLQAELPSKLRRQLVIHPTARLVEWQLHPYNLIPPLLPMFGQWDFLLRRPRLYRACLRWLAGCNTAATVEFLQRASAQRSIFFYDRPALRATETYLGMQVPEPIFLPVPVAVSAAPERTGRIAGADLQVAWVGRLYDFKVHILVHTLRRFRAAALATGKTVVFHVVGGGPKAALLDEFSAPLPGFRVKRHGDLEASDLRRLLIAEADILASMGTAALEGAALGLPVILLDFAYAAVPANYRFRWLHRAADYELGHMITAEDCGGEDTLPGMLAELEHDYVGLAGRAFAYVREHHSMEAVSARFATLTAAASLRFGEVPPEIWSKSVARKIYETLRY